MAAETIELEPTEENIDLVREKAAQLVERGWCQFRDAEDELGRHLSCWDDPEAAAWCANGALCAASDCHLPEGEDIQGNLALLDAANARVCLEIGIAWDALHIWNDEKERTAEEVIAALRGEPQ